MKDNHDRPDTPALACRLADDVFDAATARRYAALRAALAASVTAVSELPDGYRLHFAGERESLALLAEFIALERQCCPFLRFTLVLEPDEGPIHLALTGGAGVRAFLAAELALV